MLKGIDPARVLDAAGDAGQATSRYGFVPFLLIAAAFTAFSPAFWMETEVRSGHIGEAYENSDLYHFIYPVYSYVFHRLNGGQLPRRGGWNPHQLCGVPVGTDPRLSLFQPLNAIFLFQPVERALAAHAFAALFLMGLGAAFLARSLGMGYTAALLAGVVYAYSGAAASAMSRPSEAAALAWAPFVLWSVHEFTRRFDGPRAILSGIAWGLLFLSGAYGLCAATGAVALAYCTYLAIVPRHAGAPPFHRRLGRCAVAPLLGAALSAVQWLPTLAWSTTLERPDSVWWALSAPGVLPRDPGEWFRDLFTTAPGNLPRLAYVGIIPLALVPAALFHRRLYRDFVFFAAVVGGFAALAFLAPKELPFTRVFLYPAVLALSLLAAMGADRIFIPRRTYRSASIWAPASSSLSAAAAMFWAFGATVRGFAMVYAAILIPFAVSRIRGLAPVCVALIALLSFADRTTAVRNAYRHPFSDAPACYERYASALDRARQETLGARVALTGRELDPALSDNLAMRFGWDNVGGALFPLTRAQAAWWNALAGGRPASPLIQSSAKGIGASGNAALLRFMAARLIVSGPGGADLARRGGPGLRTRELQGEGDLEFTLLEDALPRAYWTPNWQMVVGTEAAIAALCDPGFDASRSCVVDALSPGIGELDAIAPGAESATRLDATCSVEDLSPEHVVLRVSCPESGVVVLADTYDPGWRATVDTLPTPLLIVNGLFRGVAVTAGQHHIEFRYRPVSNRAGLAVSLAALGIVVVAGARALFVRNRGGETGGRGGRPPRRVRGPAAV